MMTRKDYVALARAFREVSQHEAVNADFAEGWHAANSALRIRLIGILASDNPRFDRARFEDACGINGRAQGFSRG